MICRILMTVRRLVHPLWSTKSRASSEWSSWWWQPRSGWTNLPRCQRRTDSDLLRRPEVIRQPLCSEWLRTNLRWTCFAQRRRCTQCRPTHSTLQNCLSCSAEVHTSFMDVTFVRKCIRQIIIVKYCEIIIAQFWLLFNRQKIIFTRQQQSWHNERQCPITFNKKS